MLDIRIRYEDYLHIRMLGSSVLHTIRKDQYSNPCMVDFEDGWLGGIEPYESIEDKTVKISKKRKLEDISSL